MDEPVIDPIIETWVDAKQAHQPATFRCATPQHQYWFPLRPAAPPAHMTLLLAATKYTNCN